MSKGSYGFLCNDHRAADGAVLAFGQTCFGTGGRSRRINHLGVAVGGNFSHFKRVTAGAGALFLALFSTGGRFRLRPFAEIVPRRANYAAGNEQFAAVRAIGVARIAVFRAGCVLCAAKLGLRMLAVNAADFRAVTDAQTGENRTRFAALVHIAGADAHAGDPHADLQIIQTGVILHDVAVDEQASYACLVRDIDLVDHALGLMDLFDDTLDLHQVADGSVGHCGGAVHFLRLCLVELVGNHADVAVVVRAEVQLDFTAVEGDAAVRLHMHTDCIISGDREEVDAVALLILHIDAVKEGGILIIAGGVGGDIALNGVAAFRLLLGCGDRGELRSIRAGDLTQDILDDELVGVVRIVLDIVVGEEGAARNDQPAAAGQLLIGHDIYVAHLCRDGIRLIVRDIGGAVEIVGVARAPSGRIAANQRGNLILRTLVDEDRRGVIKLEAGGVIGRRYRTESIRGGVCALREAVRQVEVLLAGEVDAVRLIRLQVVIHNNTVGNADIRVNRFQQRVRQRSAVHLVGRALTVRLGGNDEAAAACCVLPQGVDLLLRVGGRLKVAGVERDGQNDHLIVLEVFVGEFALLDEFRLHAVIRAIPDEVAHIVGVTAGDIEVAVAVVDTDLDHLICLIDLLLHGGVALEFLAQIGAVEDNLQLLRTGNGADVLDVKRLGFAGLHNGGIREGLHDGFLAVRNQRQLDLAQRIVGIGRVVDGDGDLLRLTDHAQCGVGFNACDDGRCNADPDRGGYGDVAVSLRDLEVIVSVGVGNRGLQLIGGARRVEGLQRDAVLADDLDLAELFAVRIGNAGGDVDFRDLSVAGVNDRAHDLVVQVVENAQVLILGRVDAALGHCPIQTGFGEVVRQDNVAAGVGIAPLALVVILIVGGRDVPALGKTLVILGIAGPVGAAADSAFAVAHLDEVDDGVTGAGIAGVIIKGAEGGAGVVELGHDGRILDVLGLHAFCNGVTVNIKT